MDIPAMTKITLAKSSIIKAVNQASQAYGLPPFLMEGIISEIHRDVSDQARIEQARETAKYIEEMNRSEEKDNGNNDTDVQA